ncbi:hypothetical protein ACI4AF_29240, partial [Klebsiella pneumoniae]|uniref:hypothetical protein n=1 Tax=Klebsiella pneumoniae TaxID=573 RepID=UPI0038529D99
MTNKTASLELPQTEFYTVFEEGVEYPCSDGQPMADNTLQFDWMALLKWNLEAMYSHRDDVFVAGDHLIYPTKGEN